MSENSLITIRNGVITAIIATFIITAFGFFEGYFSKLLNWLWVNGVIAIGNFLFSYQDISGWLLVILLCLAFLGFLTLSRFAVSCFARSDCDFYSYTEDLIRDVLWNWRWQGGVIENLWCRCPSCHCELVYENVSADSFSGTPPSTFFACENCDEVKAKIRGGYRSYALSLIEREIRRRINTGEYKNNTGSTSNS